jgi:hypothetical protein
MAAIRQPLLRKALSFGSGIGLWLGESELRAVIVRIRPTGPALVAETVIQGFRERPAADWGRELQRFLAANEAEPYAVLALLPREEVLLRLVQLPGLGDEDAAAAVRLQVDSLHPWGEVDELVFDAQRLGSTSTWAVALARGERIDYYTGLFAEAGVKLAGLSFTASAVYHASRLFDGPDGALLAVEQVCTGRGGPVEVYGESESHPMFSAQFDAPVEQAVSLSAAEMRMEAPEEIADLFTLLPRTAAAADNADLSDQARSVRAPAYAAALAAGCLHLGEPLNLLPEALRRGKSKALYVPTMVLGAVLGLVLLGLALEGGWLDDRHRERLQAEVTRLEPAAKRLEAIDRRTAAMAERIRLIDGFRKQAGADLDLIREVNRLLPPPAFVQQLSLDGQTVLVAGEVENAESLLKAFDASPVFRETEFTMPLNRGQSGEMFRLRTKREAAR